MCYVKCQNILVNVLVHILEHLSFRLRYTSFLLSKFAIQLKLIQSVVRVGILGVCGTSSILRILLSGFWVSGSQVPSSRDPDPGSWVSGFHVPGSQFQGPGCQGLVSQGHRFLGSQAPEFLDPGSWSQSSRIPGLRIPGPRVPGVRVLGQVLTLDYALLTSNCLYLWDIIQKFFKSFSVFYFHFLLNRLKTGNFVVT